MQGSWETMRQARKLEIINFIDSLYQAHGEIKEAIEKRELASARIMLGECQDFAVEMGNAIEETEGEDCITVSHVEKYCETLFRVYEDLECQMQTEMEKGQKTIYDSNKIYKILKKSLLRVENSLKNDIKIRKEVVFFPYKASMWDSLESVYLAAKEDSDCEAYCVPIPYFDLNPDHSFGTMHYEGGEFPKNIGIIDWQAYDFEDRKPDMIFIHNPYDEWNHVTSVHPRYYARNLKNYTNQLVYIPYFILEDIKRDDPNRKGKIEGMKHFCFIPGTIYADKVIVQSEDMRRIYIEEYLKEAKAAGLPETREHLEEKILGMGSPKIDKVTCSAGNNFEIPGEWMSILEKSDNAWKKVVFYNTGVSALLVNGDKWVNKVENVLAIFKEKQDEVALLWRPHPLIEETLRSMRPELLSKYQIIRDRYRDDKWGIYDDTADLNRAIALSDIYYGDGSSVIQLFQQVKKPIMKQNVNVIYKAL